ncbi:MAG: DNRLRE domain-containing protein [Erysipelotrichaceae bacterium]|jgi:RHS repeat-associated protein|nr:DNRLRE domain-containing protein [Erysipelotrichaceae bacterium]
MIKKYTNTNDGITVAMNEIRDHDRDTVCYNQDNFWLKQGQDLLIKFNIPNWNNISRVSRAVLILPCSGSEAYVIKGYLNLDDYNPTTVTWNTRPAVKESPVEFSQEINLIQSASGNKYTFLTIDLTKLLSKLKKEAVNNVSITLKSANSVQLEIYNPMKAPYNEQIMMFLEETDVRGITQFFDYLTADAGFAGKAYVNTLTGDLTHRLDLFQTASKKTPILVGAIYSDFSRSTFMKNSMTGKWRMSFDYGFSATVKTIFISTPNGTTTNFEKTFWYDAKRYGIELEDTVDYCYLNYLDYSYIVVSDIDPDIITLIDKQGQRSVFNTATCLPISITYKNGGHITFTATNNRITKITSSDGNTVSVSYDAYNRVQYLHFAKELRRVALTYGTNCLETISLQKIKQTTTYTGTVTTYETIITSTFTHNGDLLIRADNDKTKEGLFFTYQGSKVIKLTETIKNGTTYGDSSFKYLEFFLTHTKITDSFGNEESRVFDNYGMVSCLIDKDGNAINKKHTSVGVDGVARRVSDESGWIPNARNSLIDSSFELELGDLTSSSLGWKTNNQAGVSIVNEGLYGKKALKIMSSSEVYQEVQPASKTYNASCFISALACTGTVKLKALVTGYLKVYLSNTSLAVPDGEDEIGPFTLGRMTLRTFESEMTLPTMSKWSKLHLNDILAGDISNPVIRVTIEALIDELSLSNVGKESSHNLVTNGFFDLETSRIPLGFVVNSDIGLNDGLVTIKEDITSPVRKIIGKKVFKFVPGPTPLSAKVIEKTIPVKGNAGDEFTFAMWVKIESSSPDDFTCGFTFYNLDDTIDYEPLKVDKDISDWQLISLSVVAKKPYQSVRISVLYRGLNEAFVDGFQIYKGMNSSMVYQYEKEGNSVGEYNGSLSTRKRIDKSKLIETVHDNGGILHYLYDDQERVSSIINANSNEIKYEYDTNDNVTKTVVSAEINNSTKIMEQSNVYNANNQLTKSIDELMHETTYTYDTEGRLGYKENPNGTVENYSYDAFNNLIQLVSTNGQESLTGKYEYYPNNTLKKITCDNGTNYEFLYDDAKRVVGIKLNGDDLVEYEYNLVKNGVNTGCITKQIIGGDTNEFEYNDRLQLVKTIQNGNIKTEFDYDSFGNRTRKSSNGVTTYYEYDTKGNLVREKSSNGDEGKYVIDHQEQLQKSVLKINDFVRSYEFDYDNEFSEYNNDSFVSRIDTAFGDEIIDFNVSSKGLYGATPSLDKGIFVFDEIKKRQFYRLRNSVTKMELPLNTINSERKFQNNGQSFDYEIWRRSFSDSKSIFGIFKLNPEDSNSYKVFTFGNTTRDHYCLNVSHVGFNFKFELFCTATNTVMAELSIPAALDYMFIALKLSRGSAKKSVDYLLTVGTSMNELQSISGTHLNTTNFVSGLNVFYLGNRMLVPRNTHIALDTTLLCIGAFNYDQNWFELIAKDYFKYQNKNFVKPVVGVSYVSQKTYDGYDVITLNGSLESIRGIEPERFDFADYTYKSNKARVFELDETQGKHVYGSYSGTKGLGVQRSKLTYKLGLTNTGTFAINFKTNTDAGVEKYIFAFADDLTVKLGVYLDTTGRLCIHSNGTTIQEAVTIAKDTWCKLIVTYDGSILKIGCSGFLYSHSMAIDLTGTLLTIGAHPDDLVNKHLEGNLEMLAFRNDYVFGTPAFEIHTADEQLITSKKELDILGRISKEIKKIGNLSLNTTYEYQGVASDKTSTQVSRTTDHKGLVTDYDYDSMNNITGITKGNTGKTFEYDGLNRIKEEYDSTSGETIRYYYTTNNNILRVERFYPSQTVPFSTEIYNYDASYKDKLLSVITSDENGVITSERNISYHNDGYYPASMGNITNMTWDNKKLISLEKGNQSVSYTYNDSDIRISKTVAGATTYYHLFGERIVSLTKGNKKMFFHYDESNLLIGFEYNKENYFFVRDLTANICSVIDKNGDSVVEYYYDAWGKVKTALVVNTSVGTDILELNPFLYKGYVYDAETELYYLNSRYYDPNTRRFISIDNVIGTIGAVGQHNIYAYCQNNPVSYCDPSGREGVAVAAATAAMKVVFYLILAVIAYYCAAGIANQTQAIENAINGFMEFARKAFDEVAKATSIGVTKAKEKIGRKWYVYKIVDKRSGHVLYVGMTKDIDRRLNEHKRTDRFINYGVDKIRMDPINKNNPMNYLEARGVEELLILEYKIENLLNTIHAISDKNPLRDFYLQAGSAWNRDNNGWLCFLEGF